MRLISQSLLVTGTGNEASLSSSPGYFKHRTTKNKNEFYLILELQDSLKQFLL